MKRLGVIAAALMMVAASTTPAAAQTGSDAETLQKAQAAYRNRDCPGALRLVEPVLARGAAISAPAKSVAYGYLLANLCEGQAGNQQAAYRYALAGTSLAEAPAWLWENRLGFELNASDDVAAVTSVEAMGRNRRDALNMIQVQWLLLLNRHLEKRADGALRRRLLRVLTSDGYAPAAVLANADAFRESYAVLLLTDGDKAGAAAMIRAIEEPYLLNEISVDARFRGMLPSDLDLRAATERALAEARAAIPDFPDLLEPVITASRYLRQLGRPQEALDLLETVRARVRGEGAAFGDARDKVNWWWDSMARSYAMLGRSDEANAAYRSGADIDENGTPNVSQLINLADAQIGLGRPRDALVTLSAFDDQRGASPYGIMELRFARGCANALAGNAGKVGPDLDFAKAHEADDPRALTDFLLCTGDMDGAAASVIRSLDNPETSARTLLRLSDFDPPPVALPPGPIDAKLPVLKARPDVQAAITRAGGIRRIHLQPTEI